MARFDAILSAVSRVEGAWDRLPTGSAAGQAASSPLKIEFRKLVQPLREEETQDPWASLVDYAVEVGSGRQSWRVDAGLRTGEAEGTDAFAVTYVWVRVGDRTGWGMAQHTDTVSANFEAILSPLGRIPQTRERLASLSAFSSGSVSSKVAPPPPACVDAVAPAEPKEPAAQGCTGPSSVARAPPSFPSAPGRGRGP